LSVGSVIETISESPIIQARVPLRPWLALTSIVCIVSLSLEIDVLEQVDSLSLYMSHRDIALDVAVALVLLLGLAVAWWLCVLLVARAASLINPNKRCYASLAWRIGLAVPFSYLILEVFGAIKLWFRPNWHPGLVGWILLSLVFIAIAVAIPYRVSVPKLQEFCGARLSPIGWVHIALGVVALIALWAHGVYLFRDYERPGAPVAASTLPDVYLITIDALRAEDASIYGYYRPTTPNLERFAKRCFTFDYFFANSNFTTPTTTSIETGELPWSHHVFQVGGFPSIHAQQNNLASALRERGYYTAMVTSNYLASPVHHRTIGSYDAVGYVAPNDGSGPWLRFTNFVGVNTQYTLFASLLKSVGGIRFYVDAFLWRNHYPYPAEPVFDRARSLLERHDVGQPRFVWTHIFPPHDPYLPPPPFRMRFWSSDNLTHISDFLGFRNTTLPSGVSVLEMRARYDEMILYADNAVGDYLDWLDKTGRLDHSIVIVSADHGDSFEHDWFLHSGPYLHNGLIHIPLLIHLPGQRQAVRVYQPAQQVDLLPTILDLVGAQVPDGVDGISLRPVLEGHKLERSFIYSMNLEPNRVFDPIQKGTVAIIDGEYKYVYQLEKQQESLYRYKTDELEEHNLVGSQPEVSTRLRTALFDKLKAVNQRSAPKP
jgi:arylsulfatase A-like enzyme